jgi:peptide/nickel transport system permease protein
MKFLLQRIGFYSVAFWVALTLNYLLPRLTGQSVADGLIQSNRTFYTTHPEQIQQLYAQYGHGNPDFATLVAHYPGYLLDMLTFHFGISVLNNGQPVLSVIGQTLPYSIFLVGSSVFLACVIGTFVGMYCAWHRNGPVDSVAPSFFIAIGAFPSFFVALLAIYFVGLGGGPFHLHLFPTSLTYDSSVVPGWNWTFVSSVLQHAELPVLILTLLGIGGWLLIMRNVMINNIDEDYITMGRAKGVRDWRLMTWYAGRNSILPTFTAFAGALGFAVTGSILIETVLSYQGMGYTLARAAFGGDFPLAQACLLVLVLCVLGANFIMDSIYVILDPRTRVS